MLFVSPLTVDVFMFFLVGMGVSRGVDGRLIELLHGDGDNDADDCPDETSFEFGVLLFCECGLLGSFNVSFVNVWELSMLMSSSLK